MTPLDQLTHPIQDCDLPGLRPALENLQGNILRGHGRDRSVHIFLTFKVGASLAKRWIHRLAERVTSAQRQHEETEEYRKYHIPGRLFCNFFLSAAGYQYIGAPLTGHSPTFSAGMQGARERLGDPAVGDWESGYQQPLHAMVLLADDDEGFLLRQARQLLDDAQEVADICVVEHGRAMRNEQDNTIEHFGYVDGRSQPLFFQSDIIRENKTMGGTDTWDPGAGPHLVIVKEPQGGEHDFGSYLVFRKLEQNVCGFKAREAELAKALGLQGEAAEKAGALVIGRFEDGTPILLQDTEGLHTPVPNNFTFAADPEGQRCPFQAHIRKVNPRGEFAQELGEPSNIERQHRIARRGITYGTRQKASTDGHELTDFPTAGVGLLFMCYQQDLTEQFEFLQTKWASNEDFLRPGTGIDPIIVQAGGDKPLPQQWLAPGHGLQTGRVPFSFHGFVTLKGGEYFFAPSLSFLKAL